MRDFERDAELKTLRSCLAQQTDLVNQLLQKLNSQEIEQEKKRPEAEETSKQPQHDLQTRSAKQDQDDSQMRPAKQKQKRMTSNTSRSTSTSPIKGQGDGTLELGRMYSKAEHFGRASELGRMYSKAEHFGHVSELGRMYSAAEVQATLTTKLRKQKSRFQRKLRAESDRQRMLYAIDSD